MMAKKTLELPSEFEARVAAMLGAELEAFRSSLEAPAAGLRVNTLRITPERFRDISPFELIPLSEPDEGFVVGDDSRPGRHPYHAAGLYYLQDPGAMVVGAMVDPRPGEVVLDLAAAPGGKATHMAARMGGSGLLVANDVSPARARELASNLERIGAANAVVTAESPERLAARFGAMFDRVLVDAPCSGESMFHKSEAARADWSPAAVSGCARRQVELMEHAARLVRPGGVLVYSTCTFSPEENEETIARFLAEHGDFEMARLEGPPGAAPGRAEWVPAPLRREDLSLSVRLWPHRVPGAGHFVAGMRRAQIDARAETEPSPYAGTSTPRRSPAAPAVAVPIGREAPPDAVEAWLGFRDVHGISIPAAPGDVGERGDDRDGTPRAGRRSSGEESLVILGEALYSLPEGLPDLGGIRVTSPGLWLGTYRKGRFEPAHSLAMALDPGAVLHPVSLALADPHVGAYLRGETFPHEGPDGWTVVTVDGYALGWGKRVRGVVKNHYPKGLRSRG